MPPLLRFTVYCQLLVKTSIATYFLFQMSSCHALSHPTTFASQLVGFNSASRSNQAVRAIRQRDDGQGVVTVSGVIRQAYSTAHGMNSA